MKDIERLHKQAMDLAEKAFTLRLAGKFQEAQGINRKALALEADAASKVAADLKVEPTRSVLHRSAASLALECGEPREAERLIATALAGNPPEEIAEELRDLLDQVNFVRHLQLRKVSLSPEEIQLSISGNSVGHGMVLTEQFTRRVKYTETLVLRTAERRSGMPFREYGPPKKAVVEPYQFFLSAPRAGSFAVTFRIGRPSDQLLIPGLPPGEDVEVMNDLLESLELFSKSDEASLRTKIKSDAYFRNFTALARQLGPDGKNVSFVGLTATRGKDLRTVGLSRAGGIPEVRDVPTKESIVTLHGTLRFANALRSKSLIRIVDEKGASHGISVPEGMMTDIVKPLWEEKVTIRATKKGKTLTLMDINPAG